MMVGFSKYPSTTITDNTVEAITEEDFNAMWGEDLSGEKGIFEESLALVA